MKNLLIIAMFLFCSCGTPIYQMKTDCNATTDELISQITTVLIQEGFQIKVSNKNYLQAETLPDFDYLTSQNSTRIWMFSVSGNKVTAQVKTAYVGQNGFGATTNSYEDYYDDSASEGKTWYWNVRNELQKICGNGIVFIEKERN